jgi:hypothetical protein
LTNAHEDEFAGSGESILYFFIVSLVSVRVGFQHSASFGEDPGIVTHLHEHWFWNQ